MIRAGVFETGHSGVVYSGLPDGCSSDVLSGTALSVSAPDGAYGAKMLTLGGNSVKWNQLFEAYYVTAEKYGLTCTASTTDNSITVNGTCTEASAIDANTGISPTKGNILFGYGYENGLSAAFNYGGAKDYGSGVVFASSGTSHWYLRGVAGTTYTNAKIKPRLFDMTQMFGVTTTDAVTDEMKAFCKQLVAADNAAYEDNTIKSATVTALKIGSTSYSISSSIQSLDGYGLGISDTVRNYIDFGSGQYVQMVESVSIGSSGEMEYTLCDPVIKTDISSYIAGNISNYNGITSGGKVTFTSSTNVPPRYSVKFVEDAG